MPVNAARLYAHITEKSHTKNVMYFLDREGVRMHLTPLVRLRHCDQLTTTLKIINGIYAKS